MGLQTVPFTFGTDITQYQRIVYDYFATGPGGYVRPGGTYRVAWNGLDGSADTVCLLTSGSGRWVFRKRDGSPEQSNICDLQSSSSSMAQKPSSTTEPSPTATLDGLGTLVVQPANYRGPKPTCTSDGAPWISPTAYCDCDSGTHYPTLSVPSTISDYSSAVCAYTSLPSETINPITTSAPPTNIPGQGGLPACAANTWAPGAECPYASGIGFCDCGGTLASPLPTSGVHINCDYTLQPTANNCPVNTAYSLSLASASAASASAASLSKASVSAASAASASRAAATVFDPAHPTTSCGATFGNRASPTSVPRADTDEVQDAIDYFCNPPHGTLVLKHNDPWWINFGLQAPSKVVYQLAMEWDPRAECTGASAPSIVPSVPKGPDYWCGVFFGDLLNGCDFAAGQDKWGGRVFVNCAIVSFAYPFFLFGLALPSSRFVKFASSSLPVDPRLTPSLPPSS